MFEVRSIVGAIQHDSVGAFGGYDGREAVCQTDLILPMQHKLPDKPHRFGFAVWRTDTRR